MSKSVESNYWDCRRRSCGVWIFAGSPLVCGHRSCSAGLWADERSAVAGSVGRWEERCRRVCGQMGGWRCGWEGGFQMGGAVGLRVGWPTGLCGSLADVRAWPGRRGGLLLPGCRGGVCLLPPQKKGPEVQPGGLDKKDEAATYSSACGSTIGAEELNGRVRNGNGWGLLARPPHQNH